MRRTPLRPSSSPIRANRTRKAKEFKRAYGGQTRVHWVQDQLCVVAQCVGLSQNVHIVSGGKGRKADYDKIVPMCDNHHRILHCMGAVSFQTVYSLDLFAAAARTQAAWLEHTA